MRRLVASASRVFAVSVLWLTSTADGVHVLGQSPPGRVKTPRSGGALAISLSQLCMNSVKLPFLRVKAAGPSCTTNSSCVSVGLGLLHPHVRGIKAVHYCRCARCWVLLSSPIRVSCRLQVKYEEEDFKPVVNNLWSDAAMDELYVYLDELVPAHIYEVTLMICTHDMVCVFFPALAHALFDVQCAEEQLLAKVGCLQRLVLSSAD